MHVKSHGTFILNILSFNILGINAAKSPVLNTNDKLNGNDKQAPPDGELNAKPHTKDSSREITSALN